MKFTTIGITPGTKKELEIIAKQNCLKSMDKTINLLLVHYNSVIYGENRYRSRHSIYDY
jgi:hypothetical protein